MELSKTEIGERAEGVVIGRMAANGCTVMLPVTTARYDLVVDSERGIERVQVKTAQKRGNSVSFNSYSQKTNGEIVEYTDDEVDAYAVYYEKTDDIFWVPFDDAASTLTNISMLAPEDDHGSVKRYARDYRIEEVFSWEN